MLVNCSIPRFFIDILDSDRAELICRFRNSPFQYLIANMAEETSNLAVVVKAVQTSRLKSFFAVLLWLSSIHLVIFLSFLMVFVLPFRWSLTWAFWCVNFLSSRLILICCNLIFWTQIFICILIRLFVAMLTLMVIPLYETSPFAVKVSKYGS